jgi:biuret amidohydrolase
MGTAAHADWRPDPQGPFGISRESWLEPGATGLVVVDMQRYMTDRAWSSRWSADGADPYYFDRCEATVLPNISRLADCFRAAGAPVVYLRIAYRDPGLADVPAGVCRKRLAGQLVDAAGRDYTLHADDPAAAIDPRVAPLPGDVVVEKTGTGAFCSSALDLVLRSRGLSRLAFCGGLTDGCVESTVRQAFDRGYLCTVAEDGCVTSRPALHEAALTAMRNYFAWVTDTATITGMMGRGDPRRDNRTRRRE